MHHGFTQNPKWNPETDTLVNAEMLLEAMESLRAKVTIDRTYDIPYIAGYSMDGSTVYIDKDMPKSFTSADGMTHAVDRFLIGHEMVEKSILKAYGLYYQHAHQIALMAEREMVRAAGVNWDEYNDFILERVLAVEHKEFTRIPKNLDMTPYRDEHDVGLIIRMQRYMI